MGTWGTGISSNDIFEDVNYEFFELYNQGMEVLTITEKLIKENKELIDSHEEQNNFWIALAKVQWDCKALNPDIYKRVKNIIESKKDIELWQELNASKSDLRKRQKALESFLVKISVEKKTARKRKARRLKNAIFEKGDCLIFQLKNGDYCGVFVLESEKETEFGLNLIAVTDIKKSTKPSVDDFEKANVLFDLESFGIDNFIENEKISWYYSQYFKKSETEFETIGKLEVEIDYSSAKDYQSFSNWDNLKLYQDSFYFESDLKKSEKKIKLKKIRKKNWLKRLM